MNKISLIFPLVLLSSCINKQNETDTASIKTLPNIVYILADDMG